MSVMAAIGLGSAILDATGLGEKIGDWIGGNDGEKAARKVLDVAKQISGTDSGANALELIQTDPKLAAQVQEVLLKQETDILRLKLQDVQSARDLQKSAMESDDVFVKRFVLFFAAAWALFAMGYIIGITFFPIPEGSQRFADTALGFILGTLIANIIQYFFGSSLGSKDKTRAMATQLNDLVRFGKK